MDTRTNKRRNSTQDASDVVRQAGGEKARRGGGVAKAASRPFSSQDLREISGRISADYDRPCEATHLALMEVSPWRIHAYWNIAEADMATARARLSTASQALPLVLRFTDLSPDAGGTATGFDIEVHGSRNNWYVDLWQDGKRYAAELGLRGSDGGLVSLARSNEVELPRSGPSHELGFRLLETVFPKPQAFAAPRKGEDDSRALLRDLFPKRLLREGDFPQFMAERGAEVINEPPFPFPVVGLGDDMEVNARPAYQPSLSAKPAEGDGFPLIAAAEIDPYRAQSRKLETRILAGIANKLPMPAVDAIAPTGLGLTAQPLSIPAPAVQPATAPGPAPLSPVIHLEEALGEPAVSYGRGKLDEEVAAQPLPIPASIVQPAAAPGPAPQPPIIHLEEVLGESAFSYSRGKSDVEVAAELHLYGQSAPGSRLSLFGEPVPVDAEGRFSLRRKLCRGPALSALLNRLRSQDHRRDEG
jgi:Domain of unknown function (DUF4912)